MKHKYPVMGGIVFKQNLKRFVCLFAVFLISPVLAAKPDIAALRKKIKDKNYTFQVGDNPATQYSLQQLCGTKMPTIRRPRLKTTAPDQQKLQAESLPAHFDWRPLNGCTPVKNQGGCGSCWAFAALGAVESAYLIGGNLEMDFSEQWLISCAEAGDCSGGWYETALDYLVDTKDACDKIGSPTEEKYPYQAQNADCSCPDSLRFLITNWSVIDANPAAMKQAIYDHGPIIVGVCADDLFQCYVGGIFNANRDEQLNHAVVLVGWDDTQGAAGVWILRNSWGPGWGENGYMRIEYGCNGVGAAPCYVEHTPDSEPNNFQVPATYPTISAAMAASSGSTIITLAPGIYTGPGNTNIDFAGKPVTIRSTNPSDPNVVAATVIDCAGSSADPRRAFVFDSGETRTSVLYGLTIRNGYVKDNGGAVYCYYSSPTFKNCVFENNTATGYKKAGGAIALYNSAAIITDCRIENNYASAYGGGISCRDGSKPVISNCMILNNDSGDEGGGVYCWVNSNARINHTVIAGNLSNNAGGGIFFYESGDSTDPNWPVLSFCTITANTTGGLGGGLFIMDSYVDLNNSIVWANSANPANGPQIAMLDDSLNGTTLRVNYCDVTGLNLGHVVEENCILDWGTGNLNADPKFVNPSLNDYHLKSASGHWNTQTRDWVLDDGDNYNPADDQNSPCIDAGDPALSTNMEVPCNGARVNIGAYGGTEQASRSHAQKCCMQCMAADLNCDCVINLEDLMWMMQEWLKCNFLPRHYCDD